MTKEIVPKDAALDCILEELDTKVHRIINDEYQIILVRRDKGASQQEIVEYIKEVCEKRSVTVYECIASALYQDSSEMNDLQMYIAQQIIRAMKDEATLEEWIISVAAFDDSDYLIGSIKDVKKNVIRSLCKSDHEEFGSEETSIIEQRVREII